MPTIWPWGGFGWLKRSRFRVQGSGFKVRCSMFDVLPITFVHSSERIKGLTETATHARIVLVGVAASTADKSRDGPYFSRRHLGCRWESLRRLARWRAQPEDKGQIGRA